MATLAATIYSRLLGASAGPKANLSRADERGNEMYRLRPLPNESVYFHVKRIDNTRVVREADPQAGGTCWRSLAMGGATVALVIGALLPHAYGVLAGYQIQALKAEQQRLLDEQSTLDLDIAGLLSPERLERLAQAQKFSSPSPDSVIYLDPKADGSLAMNTKH